MTSNFLGKSFSKGDQEINLQGGIDEINSNIGYLRSKISAGKYEQIDYLNITLRDIQYHLYQVGIEIATEFTEEYIAEDEIKFLENNIDRMVEATEPMNSFIYYSGSENSTYCHIIRSIVRRIERDFVRLLQGREYPKCYLYINRLSDFFFSLARYINKLDGFKDEPMILR